MVKYLLRWVNSGPEILLEEFSFLVEPLFKAEQLLHMDCVDYLHQAALYIYNIAPISQNTHYLNM